MFQKEHKLRKVMRLTYFASVVKMFQYSNGIDIARSNNISTTPTNQEKANGA